MNKIIYLDAAASALKPDAVIAAQADFLRHAYANSGRGVCARAAAVDDMVAHVRGRVANFMTCSPHQVVFTAGATDGLNRAADIIMRTISGKHANVRVAVSDIDHHSARLPWMARANAGECELCIMPIDSGFNIDASNVPVADVMVITAMSNVFGVPMDVGAIVRAARMKNPDVITIVDAAQYVAHAPIDAGTWDADFICFSGHKIGADTGIGIMYIKNPDIWSPDKFGGGMVSRVDGNQIILEPSPNRFQAGTLPLTQIAGMAPAIDALDIDAGRDVMDYLHNQLRKNDRIKIFTAHGASVLTFMVRGMHPVDVGAMCGARGLCMRAGNMCATWAMHAIGVPGALRLSAGAWNTMSDAAAAVEIINAVVK